VDRDRLCNAKQTTPPVAQTLTSLCISHDSTPLLPPRLLLLGLYDLSSLSKLFRIAQWIALLALVIGKPMSFVLEMITKFHRLFHLGCTGTRIRQQSARKERLNGPYASRPASRTILASERYGRGDDERSVRQVLYNRIVYGIVREYSQMRYNSM
jgi:hypothetical protein